MSIYTTENTDLIQLMSLQLNATPHDFELADFCKELEINAQPLYGRCSS